jgi:hypothetical protein
MGKASKKIPQFLQPILWSADIASLNLEENKSYIINQILSLGTIKELQWLFRIYPKKTIQKVFIHQPAKIYTPSAFHFCKNILLDLPRENLPATRYVKTLPRSLQS